MKGRRRGRGKITVLLHIAIHITNHVFLMRDFQIRLLGILKIRTVLMSRR
ncbi:hypothetical protein Hdeb2414_s0009g00314891 [Helianthus debilis subsp. tardiflorus]